MPTRPAPPCCNLRRCRPLNVSRRTEQCVQSHRLSVQLNGIGIFPLDKSPSDISPSTTTTIRQSTTKSDLPLTCTILLAVDRLRSGVWVSASFHIFALTAGEGNRSGGGGNVRGNMSEWQCPTLRSMTHTAINCGNLWRNFLAQ